MVGNLIRFKILFFTYEINSINYLTYFIQNFEPKFLFTKLLQNRELLSASTARICFCVHLHQAAERESSCSLAG